MHKSRSVVVLCAAAAIAAAIPATALAQGPHGRGGWDRGYARHGGPVPYYRGGPRFYGYGAPYSVYVAPFYSPGFYGYPIYAPLPPPPPVMVERYYIEPAPPPPPQRMYRERSYAQVEPPAPAPTVARRLERYTLSATELFEFDKATLRMPQPKLDEIADVLLRNPDIAKVEITGYTDRLGTEAYNLKLSQRRADAVKAYLARKGVAAGRLHAIGKGEAHPLVRCDDRNQAALIKCLEPNRRVEVEEITVEIGR